MKYAKARVATNRIKVIRREDLERPLKAVPKLLKLNLGCGDRPYQDYDGVDIVKTDATKYVLDLTRFPWPWKKESTEAIAAHHFFEHLEPEQRIKFMEECWRILVDGGTVEIVCPYWSSMRAIQDPTHKWPPISESSFLYFSKRWLKENKLEHAHPYKANFEFVYGYGFHPEFAQKADEPKRFAAAHYIGAVDDVFIKLYKIGPSNEHLQPQEVLAGKKA